MGRLSWTFVAICGFGTFEVNFQRSTSNIQLPTGGSARRGGVGGALSFGDADLRGDGHPQTQEVVGRVVLVEDDLDGDALDDLDEVAGGVFRGEHAEAGAGAGLHAVDVAVEDLVGEGVDLDLNGLADAHV